MRTHRSSPGGFTLIELLVVMTLMAVLATLTVAFLPTAATSAREARAATLLQGWLNVAKQRALRDRAPRGLRLHYGPATVGVQTIPNAVIACQYLEQPDDFTGGMVVSFPAIPISSSPPPTWTGPVGAMTVTITTFAPHYFYVGESISIAGGHWSSNPYVPPPAPPPPTGTPKEFNGAHVVTSVPNPTTFTFTHTGADPLPEPLGNLPVASFPPPNYGNVTSGNRLLFLDGSATPAPAPSPDLMNGYYPPLGVDSDTYMVGGVKISNYWSVQPGDYIEVLGGGLVSNITHLDYVAGQPMEVKIGRGLPFRITWPSPNYRILRAPRTAGDETLKLPDDTLIDLGTNTTYGNLLPGFIPNTTGHVDIMFSPSGSVVSRGFTGATINLWVRSPANDAVTFTDVYKGDPTIVAVFARTGFVGAFTPDRTSAYALVK